jgi:hypothetical protein
MIYLPLTTIAILLLVIAIPIGWFIAEFRANRPIRITLGVLAIMCCYGVAAMVGSLSMLSYNAWFGSATKDLINTTVEQVADGELDRVMKVLRALNRQYQPTYENRANYLELVEAATVRMRGDVEITDGSAWDAGSFDHSTWLGHWENDTGFWIIINDVEHPFDVVRSGYPRRKMEAVAISDDCRELTFHEGAEWRHTLKLINKYEVEHEWFDLEKQSVWQTDRLYKLIRPTERLKAIP